MRGVNAFTITEKFLGKYEQKNNNEFSQFVKSKNASVFRWFLLTVDNFNREMRKSANVKRIVFYML